MATTETPVCDFGRPAPDFALRGVDETIWTLDECRGENATLVMFICNHCPYVKAVLGRLVEDARELLRFGVGTVAIMPNDPSAHPADDFENMQRIAREYDFNFPYLVDDSQDVARAYGAICTPDFFGYSRDLQLQYRGRLDAGHAGSRPDDAPRELFEAMKCIALTGCGPDEQYPSMGCSIKWSDGARPQ